MISKKVVNPCAFNVASSVTTGASSRYVGAFAGDNDWIQAGNTVQPFAFIQNTLVFNISLRVKLQSTTARYAFMSTTHTTSEKGFFVVFENGAGAGTKSIRFAAQKATGTPVLDERSVDNAIVDTDWHTVRISGNGTGVSFEVDGQAIGKTTSTAFTGYSSGDSTNIMQIGRMNTGVLYFAGKMSDILITDGSSDKLRLSLNNNLVDSSSNALPVTLNGVSQSAFFVPG